MANVLGIAAHPDDLELGCADTPAAHTAAGDHVTMLIITNDTTGTDDTTTRDTEAHAATHAIGAHTDTAYTHGQKDSHQDHRAMAMASTGALRAVPRVLRHDSPSVFVDITATLDKKINTLTQHATQVDTSPMASLGLVRTQTGYRGFQARVEAAEGFEPLRLVMEV